MVADSQALSLDPSARHRDGQMYDEDGKNKMFFFLKIFFHTTILLT